MERPDSGAVGLPWDHLVLVEANLCEVVEVLRSRPGMDGWCWMMLDEGWCLFVPFAKQCVQHGFCFLQYVFYVASTMLLLYIFHRERGRERERASERERERERESESEREREREISWERERESERERERQPESQRAREQASESEGERVRGRGREGGREGGRERQRYSMWFIHIQIHRDIHVVRAMVSPISGWDTSKQDCNPGRFALEILPSLLLPGDLWMRLQAAWRQSTSVAACEDQHVVARTSYGTGYLCILVDFGIALCWCHVLWLRLLRPSQHFGLPRPWGCPQKPAGPGRPAAWRGPWWLQYLYRPIAGLQHRHPTQSGGGGWAARGVGAANGTGNWGRGTTELQHHHPTQGGGGRWAARGVGAKSRRGTTGGALMLMIDLLGISGLEFGRIWG